MTAATVNPAQTMAEAAGALGMGGIFTLALNLFDFMEVAEDEIAAARKRHPAHAAAIWNAFRLLMPYGSMSAKGEPLYRAHCRELLDRVAVGEDTRPGTKAELMAALCDTSLVAPLIHDAAVLYMTLFRDLFGDTAFAQGCGVAIDQSGGKPFADILDDYIPRERWAGSTALLEDELRRKLAQPDRAPKRPEDYAPAPGESVPEAEFTGEPAPEAEAASEPEPSGDLALASILEPVAAGVVQMALPF